VTDFVIQLAGLRFLLLFILLLWSFLMRSKSYIIGSTRLAERPKHYGDAQYFPDWKWGYWFFLVHEYYSRFLTVTQGNNARHWIKVSRIENACIPTPIGLESRKHNLIISAVTAAMCAFPSIAAGQSKDDVTSPLPPRKPRIDTSLLGQPPPLRTGRQRRPTVRQHLGDALTSKLLLNHMAPCLWSSSEDDSDDDDDDDTVSLAVSYDDTASQDAVTDELDVMHMDESTDSNTLSTSSSRTRLPKIVGNPTLSAPNLSLTHNEGRL
jgi:hypothetical protein